MKELRKLHHFHSNSITVHSKCHLYSILNPNVSSKFYHIGGIVVVRSRQYRLTLGYLNLFNIMCFVVSNFITV